MQAFSCLCTTIRLTFLTVRECSSACNSEILQAFCSPVRHDIQQPQCRAVYSAVNASVATGGPLRSALFWEWLFPGEPRTERGVETNDTAFQYVVSALLCVSLSIADAKTLQCPS
jgi:hypothetical protein